MMIVATVGYPTGYNKPGHHLPEKKSPTSRPPLPKVLCDFPKVFSKLTQQGEDSTSMKRTKNIFLTALALAALSAGAWAQTSASDAPAQPITAADVQALKDALAAQQKRIQALEDAANQREHSPVSATADVTSVSESSSKHATLENAVMISQDPLPQTITPDVPQTFDKQMEGPLTIHFRGINITPGGYAAAEFVRRSRALGADIATPFNSLTMPGASQSEIPEFFGSARQSKITTFVDGHMKNVDLSSYVSADFLSAGVTSNSNSTNSYTLRLRQAWGQAKFPHGWSVLGGQVWSLVTENGKGISPDDDLGRTNDARPKTIDPTYNVGFVFARQYGLRLTKHFNDKVAVALAVENAQGTLTTNGNASNYLLGESGASNSYNTTATYSFNPSPDIIAKIAFDPGFGHYEVFGLADRFSDRVFPCVEFAAGSPLCTAPGATTTTGAYNASREGGGIGASARWRFGNRVVFGLKGFGGSGIGRYAGGGLSDVAINPNGTLRLIKNLQGLGTLEFNLTKKLSITTYAGVEYAARAYNFDPLANKGAGAEVGYGSPTFLNTGCYSEIAPASGGFTPGSLASCTADTRALIEGTVALWYRLYSGPQGRFQFGTQYSYVTRQTWSGITPLGAPSGAPEGIDNMIFTSFRYYLP
jgi:hypothetical protein